MTDKLNELADEAFAAWTKTLPPKHWARYDLSACRLGWDAAMSAAAQDAKRLEEALHKLKDACEDRPDADQAPEPVAWVVFDENGKPEHVTAYERAAHEHINDAISEHDLTEAGNWVVRPLYLTPPDLAAELERVKKERDEARNDITHWISEENTQALRAEQAEAREAALQAWREAVIDALVTSWAYSAEHDTNPRKAIQDLLEREIAIALDPAVSRDAQALIDKGRTVERERCAQVALSYWEHHKQAYLHHLGHWHDAAEYHLQLQAAGRAIADRIRAAPPLSEGAKDE